MVVVVLVLAVYTWDFSVLARYGLVIWFSGAVNFLVFWLLECARWWTAMVAYNLLVSWFVFVYLS